MTDKKVGGKEQVHGWKIKANAELCVIREKSVLIPVNREFSILIPVNRARHPPFPTLTGGLELFPATSCYRNRDKFQYLWTCQMRGFTLHVTVELLSIYGYNPMRFTTLCGGLCQTAPRSSQFYEKVQYDQLTETTWEYFYTP